LSREFTAARNDLPPDWDFTEFACQIWEATIPNDRKSQAVSSK